MMFSTLRPDAAEAIGNIGKDVKLIIKDRSIIHAARNRRAPDGSPADVNLIDKCYEEHTSKNR